MRSLLPLRRRSLAFVAMAWRYFSDLWFWRLGFLMIVLIGRLIRRMAGVVYLFSSFFSFLCILALVY